MITLGIDPGRNSGWALYDGKKIIESGVERFMPQRGESSGMLFIKYRAWLHRLLGFTPKIDLVCYETPHHRGGAATHLLVGMATRIEEEAQRLKIEYTSVHTGTLKKWATGSGGASKEKMVIVAHAYLQGTSFDDNEADAVLLAVYAHNQYGGK